MMPLPTDSVRLVLVGFAVLGFLGVAYLRGHSSKSKLMYLVLLFILLCCGVFGWYATSGATILTEMGSYPGSKPVKVLVSVLGVPYVGGTFEYMDGPYPLEKRTGFNFYVFRDFGWELLKTECSDCIISECVNGQIVDRYAGSSAGCRELTSAPYIWNQTYYASAVKYCDGKRYSTYEEYPVGPGRYRAELCFVKAFDYDWDGPGCVPFQNVEPMCTSAEFSIR